jgi:hypothetical protein
VNILVLGIVAAVLAVGVGLLIFFLMRRTQTVVPDVAEREVAHGDRVVADDGQGHEVTESQETPTPPRDEDAFEAVLREERDELGR